jgi:site-specific DNA recombinase
MGCCSLESPNVERPSVPQAKLIALPDPKPIRCAIYTRKSTEEGLEQEFNSLDAQRECAEAYIQSQRHERWTLVPERYDDGGFTGANLDRPALRQLLSDVEAGRLDCVVVYKVDRLSRSLLHFARVMEVLDKRGVSFVSVTQQLNTNSPMGRLTLNVLLSFAEFEREIISERTRDKISAARRKGKWTGGHPMLGYDSDPITRRLVVNETEAAQVRQIFQIFLGKRSLVETMEEMARLGIRLKGWTTRKERQSGGGSFDRAALVRLLTNVIYLGEVNHKGTVYPGEQPAIVERKLWERANELMATLGRGKETAPRVRHESLLSPILYCAVCGSRMISGYTTNRGRTYHYYVCLKAQKRGAKTCPGQTVRTDRIEQAVIEAVLANRPQAAVRSKEILHRIVERIECNVSRRQVRVKLKGEDGVHALIDVTLPKTVIETRLGSELQPALPARIRPSRISQLMALAIRFETLLEEGTVRDFNVLAELGGVTRTRITQIMNLRNLAPAIQEKLLFITGADHITERELREVAQQPDWSKQLRIFEQLRGAI